MSERFDPELAALVTAERGRAGPEASTRDRVLERVQASVAAPPPSGVAPRTSAGPIAGALGPALAAVVLLGAGAAVVLATRAHPAVPPATPTSARVPSDSAPIAPLPTNAPPATAPVPVVVALGPTPSASRELPRPREPASTLPAERALLDRARSDLLSGEPLAALEEVERHARLFRNGLLAEERDALRVEALVGAHRYEQARDAGARFRAAYPGSMLRPAVDDALRTIP